MTNSRLWKILSNRRWKGCNIHTKVTDIQHPDDNWFEYYKSRHIFLSQVKKGDIRVSKMIPWPKKVFHGVCSIFLEGNILATNHQ